MPVLQARNWVFTLKRSADRETKLTSIEWQNKMIEQRGCKYMIAGREVGEGGYEHYQGLICYSGNKSMAYIKADFYDDIHLEISRDVAKAIVYCRKQDQNPILIGNEPKAPGVRVDLEGFKDAVFGGMSERELYDKHTKPMIAYPRAFAAMVNCRTKIAAKASDFKDTKVYWVTGPTGCGKSAGARFKYPDIFPVMVPAPGGKLWFDGYEGENEILLDDFAGEINFRELLRICDIYPMRCEIKGGRIERNWHVVVITSNKVPATCYDKEPDLSPLMRRIEVIELPMDAAKWPLPAAVQAAVDAVYAAAAAAQDQFVAQFESVVGMDIF